MATTRPLPVMRQSIPEDEFEGFIEAVRHEAEQGRMKPETLAEATANDGQLGDRRWAIGDASEAEWAMRKLRAARAHIRQARDQRDEWLLEIQHWFDESTASDRVTEAFFETHLRNWTLHLREEEGTATLSLPSGKVTTRTTPTTVELASDEETAAVELMMKLPPDVANRVIRQTHKVMLLEARKVIRPGFRAVLRMGCDCVDERLLLVDELETLEDQGDITDRCEHGPQPVAEVLVDAVALIDLPEINYRALVEHLGVRPSTVTATVQA